jgi:cell wall-associated NlpC family hydrolase
MFLTLTAGFADQTLVINMPENQYKPHNDLALKHETLRAANNDAVERQSAGSSSDSQVIGQVAMVTAAKASIKRLASRNSRTLYACPRGTYVAAIGQTGIWYAVLMSDSSTGFIEKRSVNLLDYRVTESVLRGQSSTGNKIVDTALRYLGISYKWGGYSTNGIDCSGFVKAVFASNGIALPRTAHEQARVGTSVGWAELRPGDRLYFACHSASVDHCGIYIGNGYFIHSSVGHNGVAVDPITKTKFMTSLVAARRL